MKTGPRVSALCVVLLVFLISSAWAQEVPARAGMPPISQQLVREGDFAISLHSALGLGSVDDETEAESDLGKVGIMPRNGWIADYPVTPDVIGELETAVTDSTDAGKIELSKEDALRKLDGISTNLNVAVAPYSGPENYQEPVNQGPATAYSPPEVIDNYYQTEGPPVITYYQPPVDYYYLYSWIPYPFWSAGYWFPGYFILHDFYRPIRRDRRMFFITNHFNDVRSHRVFRIDPGARFNGRTFAGIGVSGRRGFLSTGVPKSQRSIFNAPRAQAAPGMRPMRGVRSGYHSYGASGASGAPARRYRSATGRSAGAYQRSQGGARGYRSAPSGGRSAYSGRGGGSPRSVVK